jgi:hypothetical protein
MGMFDTHSGPIGWGEASKANDKMLAQLADTN